MDRAGLGEFLAHSKVVLDITPQRDSDGNHPLVVVRSHPYVVALSLIPMVDHLCVDAFAFVDGQRARTGAFGMEDGQRYEFARTPGTSHKWPAAALVSLLVGEQGVALR